MYLREIAGAVRDYNQETKIKEGLVYEYESLLKAKTVLNKNDEIDSRLKSSKRSWVNLFFLH